MKRSLLLIAALCTWGALYERSPSATITVLDGGGVTKTLGQGVDGSGNLLGAAVLCGASASATLYGACTNQVTVNSSGQLTLANTGFNALQGGAANSAGNPFFMNCVNCGGGSGGGGGLPQTNLNYPINITSATTTQAVPLTASTYIYVMSISVQGPTGTVTLEYGAGTNCGTGTTVLDTWLLNGAQMGKTGGPGPAYVVPAGNALCLVTAGTISQVYGSIGYATSTQTPAGFAGGGGANVYQAGLFQAGSASSAATTQVITASGTQTIYLVNYSMQTDAVAASSGTFQIVSGTGTNCTTINQRLTPVWNFAPNNGIVEGSIGALGQSNAGDALCVVTATANLVRWRIGVAQQ